MSGLAISFMVLWLVGAIAVELVLKRIPPGRGKIRSFRGLWPAGSLVGLALILTGTIGYVLDGIAISGVCFWLILADHLKQGNETGKLTHPPKL